MAKIFISLLSCIIILTLNSNAQNKGIAINKTGIVADSSAILDVNSTNQGFLIPRMTTSERNAIFNPAQSLLIYNTTTKCFEFYENSTWQSIACSCTPPSAPAEATHIQTQTEITWFWDSVTGATGYKWNTVNDYASATDMGTDTSHYESGLACNTAYTRYVWAYGSCGNSTVTTLSKTTDACCTSGSELWTQTNNVSSGSDEGHAIAVDSSGVYIAGIDNTPGNSQWHIEKRNLTTGALISTFGSGGVICENPCSSSDILEDIALDNTGLYVVGSDRTPGDFEWRIEKRDLTTGALITSFGSSGIVTSNPFGYTDEAKAVAVDSTGIYIAGYHITGGSTFVMRIEKRDRFTGALDPAFGSGGVVTNSLSSTDLYWCMDVEGSYIYLGGQNSIPGNSQLYIEKRNSTTGSLIWSQAVNPSTSSGEQVMGIKADATGVYLAGRDYAPGNAEWRIEKRDLSTGALIPAFGTAGVIMENPSSNSDMPYKIYINSTGLYIAGNDNSPGNQQIRIEARDLNTGTLLSSFGTGGVVTVNPCGSSDGSMYITGDSSGLYVTGWDNSPGNLEIWTEKICN